MSEELLRNEVALTTTNNRTSLTTFYDKDYLEYFYSERSSGLSDTISQFLRGIESLSIHLPHPSLVHDYLLIHPDMRQLIRSICVVSKNQTGNGAQLSLELYRDPEINDAYLSLYIRTNNYNNNFLNKLEDISSKFQNERSNSSGWIIITTDYQPPREQVKKNGL